MVVKDGILMKVREKDLKLLKQNPRKFWKKVTIIDAEAFAGLLDLEEIDIPEGITYIGPYSFKGCVNLKRVKIPRSATILGYGVFCDCTRLETVKILSNIEIFTEQLFKNCKKLRKINFPRKLDAIESQCFEGCVSLQEIKLPKTVRIIQNNAFAGCFSLNKIELPKEIIVIGPWCFAYCSSIEKIIIPGKETEIGNSCFYKCSNLKTIEMEKGVKIGRAAFDHSLKKIIVDGVEYPIEYNGEYFPKNSEKMRLNPLVVENAAFTENVKIIIGKRKVEKESRVQFPLKFIESLNEEERMQVLNPENNKYFAGIYEKFIRDNDKLSIEEVNGIYYFAFKIGCFSSETTKSEDMVYVEGKNMSEFLYSALESGAIKLKEVSGGLAKIEDMISKGRGAKK